MVKSKLQTEKFQRLQEELKQTREVANSAADDLAAIKTFLRDLLAIESIETDEIAVGTALLSEIVERWPKSYEPNIAHLATRAHTAHGAVAAALDLFSESGLLKAGG